MICCFVFLRIDLFIFIFLVFVVLHRLLIAVVSLAAEHWLWARGFQ